MDVLSDVEDDFNRIYDTQHVPNLLAVPGVHACTRYRLESSDLDGMARYAALYEVDSPDVPISTAWRKASDIGDWATQIRPHTTNRSHHIFKRITRS